MRQNTVGICFRRLVPLALGVLIVLVSVAAPSWAASPSSSAPQNLRALTPRQLSDYDQPAVDLVEVNTTASLTGYAPRLDVQALLNFARGDTAVQQAGNAGDDTAISKALLQEIARNPGRYLSRGAANHANLKISSQGSGFTITANGYLITNDHVIAADPATIVSAYLGGLSSDDLASLLAPMATAFATIRDPQGNNIAITQGDSQTVGQILSAFLTKNTVVGAINEVVSVSQGMSLKGAPQLTATIVDHGTPFPGKDVAILKVDANDLPTVPIGDDTALHNGDPVYAIGYPGVATFDASVITTTTYTSTFTAGVVSNRLQSSGADYRYIEHTAATNHGNSGGPLINQYGQVVGITTAGDSSAVQSGPSNGQILLYAVPSSLITEILAKNNITPAATAAEQSFQKGMDAIEARNGPEARAALNRAKNDGFNTPYLQSALDETASLPAGSASSGLPVAPLAGGLAAIVALALVVAILRRRSPARPGPVAPGPETVSVTPDPAGWWASPLTAVPAVPAPPKPGDQARWSGGSSGSHPPVPPAGNEPAWWLSPTKPSANS